MTIHAIQANDRHIDKLKLEEQAFQIEIVRQGERLNEAQAEANDAMQAMLKATQDYKALEKHKEKWQKQIKRELTLKEEDAAEDIAQAQYFQKMLAGRSDE
jgi:two-component SAPR family response regulator